MYNSHLQSSAQQVLSSILTSIQHAPPRDCAHLYSTNTMPNPQEATAVQREVDNLKRKIAELRSQLQELEEELHHHKAVLSPIRRIPAEVLGQVVTLVLPVTLSYWERRQLLNFCLVCKPWRDAALAARWIWRSVGVGLDELYHAFEEIGFWLNRSGDFPKSLEVLMNHGFESDDDDGLDAECKSANRVLAQSLTDGPILDHLHLRYHDSRCFGNLVKALHSYSAIAKSKIRPWDCLRSLSLEFQDDWAESEDPSQSRFRHVISPRTSPLSVSVSHAAIASRR
jgi:hypothetical protein